MGLWLTIGVLVIIVIALGAYIVWREFWPIRMSEAAEKNLAEDMMMGIEK